MKRNKLIFNQIYARVKIKFKLYQKHSIQIAPVSKRSEEGQITLLLDRHSSNMILSHKQTIVYRFVLFIHKMLVSFFFFSC